MFVIYEIDVRPKREPASSQAKIRQTNPQFGNSPSPVKRPGSNTIMPSLNAYSRVLFSQQAKVNPIS
jgi:hypothetical protein